MWFWNFVCFRGNYRSTAFFVVKISQMNNWCSLNKALKDFNQSTVVILLSIYWLSGFYMFTVCRWNDELMSQDTRSNFKIRSGQISSSVWCHRLCDIITAMSLWIDWYTCTINWRIDYQFALQALNTNWFFIDQHIKFGWQSTNESHRLYWLFLKAGGVIRPGTDWLVSLGW